MSPATRRSLASSLVVVLAAGLLGACGRDPRPRLELSPYGVPATIEAPAGTTLVSGAPIDGRPTVRPATACVQPGPKRRRGEGAACRPRGRRRTGWTNGSPPATQRRHSGVGNYRYGARTFQLVACLVTMVPALALVVLLTSAVKPAAASFELSGAGVGALPPLPEVVLRVAKGSCASAAEAPRPEETRAFRLGQWMKLNLRG